MSKYRDKPPINFCVISGKACYDKKGAVTAANKRWDDAYVKLRVYPCPDCNWWHLSSRVNR